jgi:hypothetical protein
MKPNKAVSLVSRMPFSGITSVRPATLRGAEAARRGDTQTLARSRARIREVAAINTLFAAVGSVLVATNTYAAVKNRLVHQCSGAFGRSDRWRPDGSRPWHERVRTA